MTKFNFIVDKENFNFDQSNFVLDTLNVSSTKLSDIQLLTILEDFKYHTVINPVYLEGILLGFVFENMGGNEFTHPVEVMSFMHLAVGVKKLNMTELLKKTVNIINSNNILLYFNELEIELPAKYLELISSFVADKNSFEFVLDQHKNLKISEKEFTAKELEDFISKHNEESIMFLENAGSINKIITNKN